MEQVPQGVAVYATSTYPALKGRDALTVEWDEAAAETRSSEEMFEVWSAAARAAGRVVEASGDPDTAMQGAATIHEAEYRFPFLAHAPMEPLDGVIELGDGAAEIWMGSQLQTVDHGTLAGRARHPPGADRPQHDVHRRQLRAEGAARLAPSRPSSRRWRGRRAPAPTS